MEDTDANRNFASSSETSTFGIKVVLILSVLLNLILSGGLIYMIRWINTMQLIIHLPMLFVLFPPNVCKFLELLLPIVKFEVLNEDQNGKIESLVGLYFEEFMSVSF